MLSCMKPLWCNLEFLRLYWQVVVMLLISRGRLRSRDLLGRISGDYTTGMRGSGPTYRDAH